MPGSPSASAVLASSQSERALASQQPRTPLDSRDSVSQQSEHRKSRRSTHDRRNHARQPLAPCNLVEPIFAAVGQSPRIQGFSCIAPPTRLLWTTSARPAPLERLVPAQAATIPRPNAGSSPRLVAPRSRPLSVATRTIAMRDASQVVARSRNPRGAAALARAETQRQLRLQA